MIRTVATFAAIVLLLALGLVLLLWWNQERMVFQPPRLGEQDVPGVRRIAYTSADGTPLYAYLVGDPARAVTSLVIHFHGNAEIAAWAIPWAREVAERSGARVLLAEYRGYAGIPGRPTYRSSGEDAVALWETARRELGASAEHTIVHGFSLGSAVAAEAAEAIHPRALLLEAPFTSARDMAARVGPVLRGPLWTLIARVHFDTRALVGRLDVPVWVAHGAQDGVIPPEMGRAVHAAARRKGELHLVPGAGHNDLRGGPGYWRWLLGALEHAGR